MSGKDTRILSGGSSDDETTTDEGKRKRDNRYPSPFERSKMMARSPVKKHIGYDDKAVRADIAELKGMFMEMMRQVTEMKDEQKSFIDELKSNKEEIAQLKTENKELKVRLEKVERSIEKTERQQKKNNVVIKGIDLRGEVREAEKFCEEKLGVKTKPESVQTFKNNDNMINIVKIKNWEEKEEIMKKKNTLKGTRVYIDHDLTKYESEVQKKLREKAKNERLMGNTATVGYQKIFINGDCWLWHQDKQELVLKETKSKN